MNSRIGISLILTAMMGCFPGQLFAYQVWTSTCKTPRIAAEELGEWDQMAKGVTGLNTNMAPGNVQPRKRQWPAIVNAYSNGTPHTFQPWAHPESSYTDKLAENVVGRAIKKSKAMGYTIEYIMIYDNRSSNEDGKLIDKWTVKEVEQFRAWLDNNGHRDIKIMYNARSYNSRMLLEHPAIEAALNEGSTEKWASNVNGRQELLKWFVSNPKTRNKDFIFQITVHHDFDPEHPSKAYEATRLMVRSISADILGTTDFVQTDRAIFLPMTYQDYPKEFPFLPETLPNGKAYGNSMTGMILSLIEQKELFSGAGDGGRLITVDQCKSRNRNPIVGK